MPTRLKDEPQECNRCDKFFITRDKNKIFCPECDAYRKQKKPKVVTPRKPGIWKTKHACEDCGSPCGFQRDRCAKCARKRYAFTIDGT